MALHFGPVEVEPTRAEIDALQEPVVIEFPAANFLGPWRSPANAPDQG